MPYLLHLIGAEPIEANSIASKAENFASFATLYGRDLSRPQAFLIEKEKEAHPCFVRYR